MLARCSNALAGTAMLALIAGVSPTLAQDYIQPSGMTQAPAAQTPSDDPIADLLIERGETYSRAPDAEQNPDEVRTTAILNAEIAAQAALADHEDAANRAAYDTAQRKFQEQNAAAQAEQQHYEAESRAAEEARLQYERDHANWEATVEACKRGDIVRCRAGSPEQDQGLVDQMRPQVEP